LPAPATLLVASAVLVAVTLAVPRTFGGGTSAFAALCALFTFTWLFVTPFQMGIAFGADGSGRLASLIPAAQVFGIACGPLVASFVVEGEQALAVPLVSAAFAAAAVLALLIPAARRRAVPTFL
jgi:DHA1 family inner membrane transport protein